MSNSGQNVRRLPPFIIGEGNDAGNWEPKLVAEKYGKAGAEIGEENVDYVALGYMTPGAALYWLPYFFAYIRTKAAPDSFHLESMIYKLGDASWVRDLRLEASEDEVSMVTEFLTWMSAQPLLDGDTSLLRASFDHAVELWKPAV